MFLMVEEAENFRRVRLDARILRVRTSGGASRRTLRSGPVTPEYLCPSARICG